MKKSGLAVLLLIIVVFADAESFRRRRPGIGRGTLLMQKRPPEISPFFRGDSIAIGHVREVCNFLTDNDIRYLYPGGQLIPRRKPAFQRHVKQVYELIEMKWLEHQPVDSYTEDLFCELALYEASLRQKAIAGNRTISRREKLRMIHDSRRSRRLFRYAYGKTDHEAANVDPANLTGDPQNSPYWHGEEFYDMFGIDPFDYLAMEKKIAPKKNMVVLFSKPSLDGSAPKIETSDTDLDNGWIVKWGDEVHTDVVGSRIFAKLGYDVDHPYYYGRDQLTLVFDGQQELKNADELKAKIKSVYGVDLSPFISSSGSITAEMAEAVPELKTFTGKQYLRFVECAIEARPDRVKRLGSFIPGGMCNAERRELRGALLLHQWIGNWDTREDNTMLSLVHMGKHRYRPSAVFSDLGTSFGVSENIFPPDFKAGQVNDFEWEIAHETKGIVCLDGRINSILPCYEQATYYDLFWMANKIARLDSTFIRSAIDESGWPEPLAELYFHKLASRRASILKAFRIEDPNPIRFDRNIDIRSGNTLVVSKGKLLLDAEKENHPESFTGEKGRFRNYGH